jgi:SHO1 osmosensor
LDLSRAIPERITKIGLDQFAWISTFICSIISTVQDNTDPYPNYSWFSIAFMFCLIVGIFVIIVSGTAHDYHVAIIGFLAAGLILTSSSGNDLIYTSDRAKEAAAAGFILLSIANVGNTIRSDPDD